MLEGMNKYWGWFLKHIFHRQHQLESARAFWLWSSDSVDSAWCSSVLPPGVFTGAVGAVQGRLCGLQMRGGHQYGLHRSCDPYSQWWGLKIITKTLSLTHTHTGRSEICYYLSITSKPGLSSCLQNLLPHPWALFESMATILTPAFCNHFIGCACDFSF